jgi:acyl-CoA synthetase (AMP-forming)/AMP-acid ligase II
MTTRAEDAVAVPTLRALLEAGDGRAIALSAPGRAPATFDELRAQVDAGIDALRRFGIACQDRVAIVLDNGPEMAAAFLTVASGATAAPLNPAYTEAEYDFFLGDLDAQALLVAQGDEGPAVACARRRDVAVIDLVTEPDAPAGAFTLRLRDGAQAGPAERRDAVPGDIALILHTSGTTSRPKMVPLSQANLCASARNIGRTLRLGPDDVAMNVMPLFHIHGLMASLAASLAAGGSVFCTPGFDALRFFGWLDEARPTWFSAVPTMHGVLVARAARNAASVQGHRLRFIRSSSAALPPTLHARVEDTFEVPMVEAYAMTEASHQMTCNPLPPGERRPGTVGVAAGPEVRIMAESDTRLMGPGEIGEVVVRGDNVTAGYLANPSANDTAFPDGWFRTGDQGYLSADGYLTLTGRLKEIINRGGEKISPREIDEVLLEHPSVEQVVVFAVPHELLGEDVAAAVVLGEGQVVTPETLRAFAAERLAAFKVPRRIVLLEAIPKGPTGKLQRIGLAQKLGLA